MSAYVDAMFSVAEMPWHKLGVVLDEPPKVRDAIDLAGLNWEVKMVDLVYTNQMNMEGMSNMAQTGEVANFKAICKMNEGLVSKVFGVVTNRYRPLQNIEAFEFFQPFLDQGLATLETAGSLKGGEVVWILAKLKEEIKVGLTPTGQSDIVRPYVLLHTAHNGKGAVKMSFNPIRVVCWNTLSMARSYDAESISHFHGVREKVKERGLVFAAIADAYRKVGETFAEMSNKSMSEQMVEEFFDNILPVKQSFDSNQIALINKKRDNVIENFNIEHKTVWGFLNAFTGFIDHDMTVRGGDDGRLSNIWFGAGARAKARAYAYLSDL